MPEITGQASRKLRVPGPCVRGPSAKAQRDGGADYGAAPGLGIYDKFSMDQFQTFLHAGQAQTPARDCRLGVKANSRIAHRQLNLIRRILEANLEVPRPAMLDSILEPFLQDAKEAKRDLLRQLPRDLVGVKLNLDSMFLG